MPKRTFKRSAKSIAARKELINLSQLAKATKQRMINTAQSPEAALVAACITINDLLLEMHKERSGQPDFRRLDQWNEAGFKVKKGSEAYRVWGTPKRGKNEIEAVNVSTGEQRTLEEQYEYWPICCLFHAGQVDLVPEAAAA